MMPFSYTRPETLADAVQAMSSDAKFIAGGTNLLDLMKLNIEKPSQLVDINRLPLDKIEKTEKGELRIGALVRNADLAANETVREHYGVLSRALLAGASGQLRNMATTGGNLLQRTRCYYFYDTNMPCNKREPNSGCSAIGGYNRIHAILGASSACIAVHPSDMAVAMALLEAKVETQSVNGAKRSIAMSDLHRLPGDTPQIETTLEPGEIITSVVLPAPLGGTHIYRKVRDRASYAFALISVAAVIKAENGKITQARLAFGGLAHKPWRVKEAEDILIKQSGEASFASAADAVLAGASGQGSNDFKIPLLRRTLVSVLREATKA